MTGTPTPPQEHDDTGRPPEPPAPERKDDLPDLPDPTEVGEDG
ncbi:hypothetical protein SB397_21345 [Burkholderia multivorans]|nr:hypothetical protein [Burkholderia multivorans]MEB2488126.1 hypothetical protein [Burkholderia multivorans]MEB2567751.1 hypothetical protein [Burkholderia multivorans]